MAKKVIELQNIKRDFRVGDETVHALRGISFTIPLSAVSQIVSNGLESAAAEKTIDGSKIMKDEQRQYDLIIAAVAANYVDDAMEAARSAGAAGGTIVRGRSTSNDHAGAFRKSRLEDGSGRRHLLRSRR